MNKTYSQKQGDVKHDWYIIDASKSTLGRVASEIAKHITGKQKPTFTPHIDNGDHVVVINAEKVQVTGNKELTKKYYRHSSYPGSLKESTLKEKRADDPAFIITNAVQGMLPKNKLQAPRMKRLHVYVGTDHKHEGQKPKTLEVK